MLVVLAARDVPTHVYDGSLAMGNMLLAADSLGLGSIWIHRAREVFDSEEGRAILAQLGVEGDYEGIGHCAVGFREGQKPEPPARREAASSARRASRHPLRRLADQPVPNLRKNEHVPNLRGHSGRVEGHRQLQQRAATWI